MDDGDDPDRHHHRRRRIGPTAPKVHELRNIIKTACNYYKNDQHHVQVTIYNDPERLHEIRDIGFERAEDPHEQRTFIRVDYGDLRIDRFV
jgi:hypothetical protein